VVFILLLSHGSHGSHSRALIRGQHRTACRCILKMDHHCPWFNACVGHFNHRYFYLFMLYIWLGCIYVCAVAYAPFTQRKELRNVTTATHSSAVQTLAPHVALSFLP
jgi:hypothetical protein